MFRQHCLGVSGVMTFRAGMQKGFCDGASNVSRSVACVPGVSEAFTRESLIKERRAWNNAGGQEGERDGC
jgi:hypothetical protein